MNRLLLLLVPDKSATFSAGILSASAFLLGLLDILTLDLDSARFYLNLSMGIMAFLFLIKFISLKAAYTVAEHARTSFHQELVKAEQLPPPADLTEAQEQALEKAKLVDLANEIKRALNSIPADCPTRPKYEATLEMMQRRIANPAIK